MIILALVVVIPLMFVTGIAIGYRAGLRCRNLRGPEQGLQGQGRGGGRVDRGACRGGQGRERSGVPAVVSTPPRS